MKVSYTEHFYKWLSGVKDRLARTKLYSRIRQMTDGNLGHFKSVGGGVLESIIDYGPGYRIYFARKGDEIIILLAGSTKKSQEKSILEAKKLWKEIKKTL